MATCQICGRVLNQVDETLSQDCGGDCWGCVGEIEAEAGWPPSLDQVRREHALGLRPGWRDPQNTQTLTPRE